MGWWPTDVLLPQPAQPGDPGGPDLLEPRGQYLRLRRVRGEGHRAFGGRSRGQQPLNPYRYSARRFDSGSQTIDMGARRFGPDVARFLQPDLFLGSLVNLDGASSKSASYAWPRRTKNWAPGSDPRVGYGHDADLTMDDTTSPRRPSPPCRRGPVLDVGAVLEATNVRTSDLVRLSVQPG